MAKTDGGPAPNPNVAHVGALVRTARRFPEGIHRALVSATFDRGGEAWVRGVGWEFPAEALEVIRPSIGN